MRKFLLQGAALILILLGCVCIYASQSTFMITISTLLWIGGYAIWLVADPKSYNDTLDLQKMVEIEGSIAEIYKDMKNIETPLGKPWLCKVFSIKGKALVYGPNVAGDYIYIYRSMGMVCLVGCSNIEFLEPEESQLYRLDVVGKSREDQTDTLYTAVSIAGLLEEMERMYDFYGKNGYAPDAATVKDIFGTNVDKKCELYTFTEDFKLSGQKFFLQDLEGNILYDVEGTYPLKTLRIRKHGEEEVVFRVTKRLLHLLPYYDFYEGEDKKIGSFSKEIDVSHDSFKMNLPDGILSMRSVVATFGDNYIVRIGSRQIGAISENLNLNINNLVFDNMVIEVFDHKYLLIMAALAIMSAREMSRDRDD